MFEAFEKHSVKHRRVSRADYPRIVEMYQQENFSLQVIGDEFGVSRERIRQILARLGIASRSAKLSQEVRFPINEAEVVKMYVEEKLPIYAVMKKLRTTQSRITTILARHGVTKRSNRKELISKDALRDLYIVQGKTQAEIGEMLGVGQNYISAYVIRYGLKKPKNTQRLNKKT